MTYAYDEIYVAKAQSVLAQMLRYGVEDLRYGLNDFFVLFLQSGIAGMFGHGDYRFIVGMSGVEVAYEVLWRMTGEYPSVKPQFHLEKSPVYWTGWVLAYYQWYTGKSFERIFENLTPEEICRMYVPYHEMDLLQFVEAADRRILSKNRETRLKIYRSRLGLSQGDLAKESGTSVRMIQNYEQRRKEINHAQADTLQRLAKALHCSIEELLE